MATPFSASLPHYPRALLILPLLLALAHIFLHPHVSVSTGEAKLRGFYIDENAVSSTLGSVLSRSNQQQSTTHHNHDDANYPLTTPSSFCDNFQPILSKHIPECIPSPSALSISLQPVHSEPTGAFHLHILSKPTPEALIFLMNFVTTINKSKWLPVLLHATLGEEEPRRRPGTRTLIVLVPDISSSSSSSSSSAYISPKTAASLPIRILAQGSRGIVPNLDLVSTIVSALKHHLPRNPVVFTTSSAPSSSLLEHYVHYLKDGYQHSPHDKFLTAGVDSVTLHCHLPSALPAMLTVARCMSTLEERLHHSVRSYILLPGGFLSNGEFLYTLVLAAAGLALYGVKILSDAFDGKGGVDATSVGVTLTATVAACVVYMAAPPSVACVFVLLLSGAISSAALSAIPCLPILGLVTAIVGIVLGMEWFANGIVALIPPYLYVVLCYITTNARARAALLTAWAVLALVVRGEAGVVLATFVGLNAGEMAPFLRPKLKVKEFKIKRS
jgi:hypothetical protein